MLPVYLNTVHIRLAVSYKINVALVLIISSALAVKPYSMGLGLWRGLGAFTINDLGRWESLEMVQRYTSPLPSMTA